jgi:hypothetical protein
MRFAAFLVLALLLSRPAHAETFKDVDAAVGVTGEVMKRVVAGDLKGGFDLVKSYAVVPDAEVDAMRAQAEAQRPVLVARFGQSIGYEFVRKDSAGGSLVKVVYLQRFEKHAMVWRFVLYRGAEGWKVNSFKYADDIWQAFEG